MFDESQLRHFAEVHVRYEVVHLNQQAQHLAELSGADGEVPETPEADAYLEAFLVHARLLDDFFGMSVARRDAAGQKQTPSDDVLAWDYDPTRTQKLVLDPTTRSDINGQVQHLAMRRQVKRKWSINEIDSTLSRAFHDFLTRMETHADPAIRKRAGYFPTDDDFSKARMVRHYPGVLSATTSSTSIVISDFRDFRRPPDKS